MGRSVSRSVYSHSCRHGCTLFEHPAGRLRTVVVRIRGSDGKQVVMQPGKGLKSWVFPELARFLLSA
jgi:hypothetical protein